jgi:hypothetical protein
MEIKIKDRKSPGFISLAITGREASEEWLIAETAFHLNGFNAEFGFSLMLGDLVSFFQELQALHRDLKGVAHLRTIEDNVQLTFSIDELGHVNVNGTLRDSTYTIETSFLIETDQTYLTKILDDCRYILRELKVEIN